MNRFAKIGFRCSGKAVGAVTQINLVQVNLKYLVFAQQVFEFVSQQQFINFAGECFLRGQVHIACHLHGDGRGALAFGAAHIGQAGAGQTDVVDTAVFVKARIFNGQDRLFDHIGNLFEWNQLAPFFAKFTDDFAFHRKHAHRQLGTVVDQIGNIGQLRIGHHQRHTDQQQDA